MQAYSSLGARDGWPILSTNLTLKKMAQKYEKTVAQILLKWALQHDLCMFNFCRFCNFRILIIIIFKIRHHTENIQS